MAVDQQEQRQKPSYRSRVATGLSEILDGDNAPTIAMPPVAPLTRRPAEVRPHRSEPQRVRREQEREQTTSQPTTSYEFETTTAPATTASTIFDKAAQVMTYLFGGAVMVAITWLLITSWYFGGYVLDVASCQKSPMCQARFYFGGAGEQATHRASKLIVENTGVRFSVIYKPGDEWLINNQPVSKLVWRGDVAPGSEQVRPLTKGCNLDNDGPVEVVIISFGGNLITLWYDSTSDTLREATVQEKMTHANVLAECVP